MCVLSLSFLNDVVFSYLSTSFLLDSSICSALPVCHSSPCCGFDCFLICTCAFLCFLFEQGSRAFGKSSWISLVLIIILLFILWAFLRLHVCQISKLDTLSSDTFFLADVESQSLPLSHSLWRTGGIKAALIFLNNLLPCICENKCTPCSYFTPLNPKLYAP